MTTRADTLLAQADRTFLNLPVPTGAVPPATTKGQPRTLRLKTDPAASRKLDRAIRGFRDHQAALVDEAAALLTQAPGKFTEEMVSARVHRGLWVAWARYLAAPDAKAAFQAATAFGIFFDKWRLTQGLPTAITEERREERLVLLAKIQAVLEQRGAPPARPAIPVSIEPGP